MAPFFVLDYSGGTRGVPVFVDGVIEEYVSSPWNDFAPGAEEYYRDQSPMNFRTKHRVIDFDYCNTHGLFICSELFIERLAGFSYHIIVRPLRVWAARNKECTQKKFFLLRVQDRLWAMDTERSEYRVNRDPKSGEIRYGKWAPTQRTYRNVFKLYIDEAKTQHLDLFYCQEPNRNIVSNQLATKLAGLKGVRLTPTPDYVFPLVGEKIVDRG